MRRFPTLLLSLLPLLAASPALAQVELKNDGFTAGGTYQNVQGFVSGEIAAVRLVAPAAGRTLREVRLMFAGSTTSHAIRIHVWEDTGLVTPGTELYVGDTTLAGVDGSLQVIDLSSANVVLPAAFRVGVEFLASGLPTLARDTDGTITSASNFVYSTSNWTFASAYGLTGDWILRAVVSEPAIADGGGIDGGSSCTGNADCGAGLYCDETSHVCTFDCRTRNDCGSGSSCNSLGQCVASSGGDGCGCAVASRADAPSLPLAGLVLALLVRRRRR